MTTSVRVSFSLSYFGGQVADGQPARQDRAVTPLDRKLTLTARLDREEGRKWFLTGDLRGGDTPLADVEGLFVAPRPGKP